MIQGLFFKVVVWIRSHGIRWEEWASHTSTVFARKQDEVVASDLVAGDFPTDVGEGGVNLAIPLVSAIEYVYLNHRAFVDAYQLVAGFQFDVVAFGSDAYRGLASLF